MSLSLGGDSQALERWRKLQWGLLIVCADSAIIVTGVYWTFLYNGWTDQLNLQVTTDNRILSPSPANWPNGEGMLNMSTLNMSTRPLPGQWFNREGMENMTTPPLPDRSSRTRSKVLHFLETSADFYFAMCHVLVVRNVLVERSMRGSLPLLLLRERSDLSFSDHVSQHGRSTVYVCFARATSIWTHPTCLLAKSRGVKSLKAAVDRQRFCSWTNLTCRLAKAGVKFESKVEAKKRFPQ